MLVKWVMTLVSLSFSTLTFADCSVGQRVELAKAGYEKTEIESLCSQPVDGDISEQTITPSAASNGIVLLRQGTIEGSNSTDREKRRCAIRDDGVVFKNDVVPFEQLIAFTLRKVDAGDQELYYGVKLRPARSLMTMACNLMIVDNWRYKQNDNTLFLADAEKFQAEYEAVVRELRSRGVEIKGAEGR